jgi:Na+/melibiose symporter-like transporter
MKTMYRTLEYRPWTQALGGLLFNPNTAFLYVKMYVQVILRLCYPTQTTLMQNNHTYNQTKLNTRNTGKYAGMWLGTRKCSSYIVQKYKY